MYEEKILAKQDSMEDDCVECKYRGEKCKGQCSEIKKTIPLWLKHLGYK